MVVLCSSTQLGTDDCRSDPSSGTASENIMSAATVAAKLPESSDSPAGRRIDTPPRLGVCIVSSPLFEPLFLGFGGDLFKGANFPACNFWVEGIM